ncbi:disks large-associated protein 5-like isoform X1 [Watersipora subatra]|uniref:disks large-associated protein 5-like isoform X1 n=1 Tax=Watersipora subatra TaxID=2589382 RepID=UPI00355B00C9
MPNLSDKTRMERLEALWKWQKEKKTKVLQSHENLKGPKSASSSKASSASVPSYMKLTESAMLRQRNTKGKPAAKSVGAQARPARPKQNIRHMRETKPKTRTPLKRIQPQNVTKVHLEKNITFEQKPVSASCEHVKERKKVTRKTKRQASLDQKLLSAKKPVKREQLSPDGAVSKRRRVGDLDEPNSAATRESVQPGEASVDVGTEEVDNGASPKLNVTIKKSRKSFAPANTQFEFHKSIPGTSLRADSTSGSSSLESIAETAFVGAGDEVFSTASSPKKPRKASTRVKTPGIRRTVTIARSAAGESDVSAMPIDFKESPSNSISNSPVFLESSEPDRYSKVHTLRQRLLSEKLQRVVSPGEKIAVLSQSPMIELSRKRSRPASRLPSKQESGENQAKEDEVVLKNVKYFKDIVVENTEKLEKMACYWDAVNDSLIDVDESVHGEIRTISCQARLIIAERFTQFTGLIANCENKTGIKPVLEEDLDGFWDMIYFQVEDVLRKFEKLECLRSAGWKTLEDESSSSSKSKPLKKKTAKVLKKAKGVSKFGAFKKAMMAKKLNSSEADQEESAAKNTVCQANTPILKTPAQISSRVSTPADSVENCQSAKTYAFRRTTVEKLLDSSLKTQTPRESLTHKNVLLRSRGSGSARRLSKHVVMAIPPKLEMSPVLDQGDRESGQRLSLASASPDLAIYLTNTSRCERSLAGQARKKSCSPSPSMVRAMLSASKSGRKKSLCQKVLSKSLLADSALIPAGLDSSLFSPAAHLNSLRLDDTPAALSHTPAAFVDDLVVFTPLPKTPQDTIGPLVTPRRSARIARNKRISLL